MSYSVGFVLIWMLTVLKIAVCQRCPMVILDDKWPEQWYLQNPNPNGYDMNVMPAWESCINGTGVTVGVVDQGIKQHRDINKEPSLNFGPGHFRNRNRGSINLFKHGTRVAGIIGAKKNGQGIIGVAFGATIADIRITSTSVFETLDLRALKLRTDIDVYSCSFANFHTGTKTYPLLPDQKDAFRIGTTFGRGRLGSVYVFGTGNSGGDESSISTDSCAYDGLVTNRFVISVAGIQHNLRKMPSGEACSAMMVAAFTADPGDQYRIVTTDVRNRYTYFFNQNSAAVPMVSGAVALALDANPNLSYRDIMHLLVETSRSDLPDTLFRSMFTRNAANITFSSYFGFGLLDIGKLVDRSRTWENVPQITHCTARGDTNMPMRNGHNIIVVSACSVTYIEHVEVSLKVNHRHAGQIRWVLISPYGTRSTILPGRALDPSTRMDYTVFTVQLWGENPNGNWRLEPTAVFGKTLERGMLESVSLRIHGFQCRDRNRKCLPQATRVGRQDYIHHLQQQVGRQDYRHHLQQQAVVRPSVSTSYRVPGNKDGECPTSLPRGCFERCTNDTDCRGQQKCCYNGCGHTCHSPILIGRQDYRHHFQQQAVVRPSASTSYRVPGCYDTSPYCSDQIRHHGIIEGCRRNGYHCRRTCDLC